MENFRILDPYELSYGSGLRSLVSAEESLLRQHDVGVVNTQQHRIVCYSVAEPLLQGLSRSREPHHLFGKQKEKPCSCDKHDLTAMYKGKYVPKSSVAEPK